jgi:rubrerythrin
MCEVERLSEWKDAVLGIVKRIPEYETGEWGGDKEGWGFVFELVKWQTAELKKLQAIVKSAAEGEEETDGAGGKGSAVASRAVLMDDGGHVGLPPARFTHICPVCLHEWRDHKFKSTCPGCGTRDHGGDWE